MQTAHIYPGHEVPWDYLTPTVVIRLLSPNQEEQQRIKPLHFRLETVRLPPASVRLREWDES